MVHATVFHNTKTQVFCQTQNVFLWKTFVFFCICFPQKNSPDKNARAVETYLFILYNKYLFVLCLFFTHINMYFFYSYVC